MAGTSYGWINPLLVRLLSPASDLPMTPDQSSWVVALIELGDLFSPLPAALLVDAWGRKPLLLSTAPMYIISWILVLTTRSVPVLYFVRILQGFGMGIVYTVLPMYLAEISQPKIRGAISTFFEGMWCLGILLEYCLGPFLSYQGLSWASLAVPVAFLATFLLMPESPYFLVMVDRPAEASRKLFIEDLMKRSEQLKVIMMCPTVQNVLHKSGFKPFNLLLHQEMNEDDFDKRLGSAGHRIRTTDGQGHFRSVLTRPRITCQIAQRNPMSEKYRSEMPLTISVGFGGYLSVTPCLSLTWLRGEESTMDEMEEIEVTVKKEMKTETRSWKELFSTPADRRAFLIVQVATITKFMSGIGAVLSYSSETFSESTRSFLSPDQFTMLMGLLIIVSTLVASFTVDHMGRRPLLLISSLGCAVFEMLAALYYYLDGSGVDTSPYSWVAFASVASYCVIFSLGVGPLVPVLQAELFPSNTRGLASGITTITDTVTSLICMKLYEVIASGPGLYINYLIYALFSLAGLIVMYLIVPETKGRSFAQIQSDLAATYNESRDLSDKVRSKDSNYTQF
ncbi:hypothetical protein J6590_021361 [Homalodisca vitripennis]|nr:hypothetical protein J6590_021361 [Homalodisca vitripennis]